MMDTLFQYKTLREGGVSSREFTVLPNDPFSNNGTAARSDANGETWTSEAIPPQKSFESIWCPSLGLHFAIGATLTGYTSPDGVTWTSVALPISPDCCAWSPTLNLAVIIAGGGANGIATSPDLQTWTLRTGAKNMNHWRQVKWSPQLGLFCAVTGNNINILEHAWSQTSVDGINWIAHDFGVFEAIGAMEWNGQVFCAVSHIDNASNYSRKAWTSLDGFSWSDQGVVLPASASFRSMAWNGNVFCALQGGASNTLAVTSPTGAVWTSQTLPAAAWWRNIRWSGRVFLGVSGGAFYIDTATHAGTVGATSPDGATWTQRTLIDGPWGAIAVKAWP